MRGFFLFASPGFKRVSVSALPHPAPDAALPAEAELLAAAYRAGAPILPVVAAREGGALRLVSGAERLAAARAAGVRRVPALIVRSGWEAAFTGLLLSCTACRRDPFAEARMLKECLRFKGRREMAEAMGASAAAVGQKLRLLQLPLDIQARSSAAGLTEGQLGELMRLPAALRSEALDEIGSADFSSTEVSRLIRDKLCSGSLLSGGRRRVIVKDARIFQNTVQRSVEILREAGLDASCVREQGEGYVEYRVRMPENQLLAARQA